MQRVIFVLSGLFLVFWLIPAAGQSLAIGGEIVDQTTGEGVPFAHVAVMHSPIGAIADLYGKFSLSVPQQYSQDSIRISCVGYKAEILPIRPAVNLQIILQQDIVQLKEIVIRPEKPDSLLREAVRRIPENYDTNLSKLSSYYKVAGTFEGKRIRYTEAFVNIFKNPYQAYNGENAFKDWGPVYKADSIQLKEIRTMAGQINDWKLNASLPWESNMYEINSRDIVREFSEIKDDFNSFMKSYHFDIEQLVKINGRGAYKIRLIPRKHKKTAYWNGYIYLDEETLAFVKIDILSTPELFRKLKSDFGYVVVSNLYGIKYDSGEWKEQILYRKIGNKWYFDEVNSGKHFVITSKKRNIHDEPANFTLHFKVDSITTIAKRDTSQTLRNKGHWWDVARRINNLYDSAFWRDFDRKHGVITVDSLYRFDNKVVPDAKPYTFTRRDTLQGALTPLRTCFDVGYYHLSIAVDPGNELLRGSSLIRFTVTAPTNEIQVDLYSKMGIDSVVRNGRKLPFRREYNAVYVTFPDTLKKGSVNEVTVYFNGHPLDPDLQIPMYGAFLWDHDQDDHPWLEAVCQGYGASGWWPNKDHLSDEPDSADVSVTVPGNLYVVSNGRLQQVVQVDSTRKRYDWHVSYPINNYDITLYAGKYIRFSDTLQTKAGELTLDYYVMPYNLESAKRRVAVVKPMLRTYEKYFGPYPFPRDGFKLVDAPYAMEHQSAVSVGLEYFKDNDEFDWDDHNPDLMHHLPDYQIVLHECAHEWWGNSVSCSDNADLWIHEAFATYAESLFMEDRFGYDKAQQYLNALRSGITNQYPIVGKPDVNDIHYNIWDMYSKGALMLNTLRHVIANDSLWFSILKGIQQTFKYQTISTKDIVDYISMRSGQDLGYFFDQYLKTTEIPILEVSFDDSNTLRYRWTKANKDFHMPVGCLVDGKKVVIHPNTDWQSLESGPSGKDSFQVLTGQFLVDVEEESTN